MNRFGTLVLLALFGASLSSAQVWDLAVPQRAIFSIASNPLNPASIIAGGYARTYFATTDAGSTWQEMYVGNPGGTSQVSMLVFHPRDTMTLFAGGLGFTGVDRSTDGGMTWENVLRDPENLRFEVASNGSVAFHPGRPDTMYVIRNSNGVIYRSMNRGENWDSIGVIPGLVGTDRMRALAICPTPDSSNVMLACGRRATMWRSSDNGRTWASTGYILAGHPDTDGAQIRWSPTQPGTVYAASQYSLLQNAVNAGLHKSTDYGLTWTRIKFQDTSLYALEVFPTKNGDEIFVGGAQISLANPAIKGDSIVFRSVDGGATWQDLSNVSWGSNEIEDTSANVWGFAVTMVDGRARVLMATEVGLYASDAVTSVAISSQFPTNLPMRVRRSGIDVDLDDAPETAMYVVADLLGRVVGRGSFSGSGTHHIDLSGYPPAPYLVRVIHADRAGAVLTTR